MTPGLSRVELEPVLAALLRRGTPEALAEAEAIRAELAARVWQWHNPYATDPLARRRRRA